MGGLLFQYRLVGYPVAGEHGRPLLVWGECFLNVGQRRAPADACMQLAASSLALVAF